MRIQFNINDAKSRIGGLGMRLLIVEDSKDMALSLMENFQAVGFLADITYDGESALRLLSKEQYACIILDVILPGIDGYETIELIRKSGNRTPVILMTGLNSVEDRVKGFQYGADDYIAKPFDFGELQIRVDVLIRRATQAQQKLLRSDAMTLNALSYECRVNDEMIPLRRREFDILELLMNHKNEVLSRDKIIECVWKKGYAGSSNVVDVHIKYLRDKLRPYNLDERIVTIRGVGYKFAGPVQAV